MLPHYIGKWVGRAYFRPCLPCTIFSNKREFKGKWWAYVDAGNPPVLLGQASKQALTHATSRRGTQPCDRM